MDLFYCHDLTHIQICSGFKELVPNFAIRDTGNDEQRLRTCVNLLKVYFDYITILSAVI